MGLKQLLVSWAFVLSLVPNGRTQATQIFQRSLKLDRASGKSLMIEVPCQPFCENKITVEHKTSLSSEWVKPKKISRHSDFNDTFVLEELQPDTLYYIRARLDPPGEYTQSLSARTCPEQPPPVRSLRVEDAGAGWLDVKWTPPTETCRSRYWYSVRYKAEGKDFTPFRKYGMFNINYRYIRFGPTHPCPTWPNEFCLLLTDSVEAGKNHTVEVQVVRKGSLSSEERSSPETTFGFADTSKNERSFCHQASNGTDQVQFSRNEATSTSILGERVLAVGNGLQVPLWVTISGWATAAFVLIVIIVMFITARCRKTDDTRGQRTTCPETLPSSSSTFDSRSQSMKSSYPRYM